MRYFIFNFFLFKSFQTEHAILFDSLQGEVVDSRISCEFKMQIVPQISSKNGRIWNLNHKYYIFGATGPAQPDELTAHDTSQGSHYYPIVSARAINPALIGSKLYELPPAFVEPSSSSSVVTVQAASESQNSTSPAEPANNTHLLSASVITLMLNLLLISFTL